METLKRVFGRPFKPGQSGNPSGKPKGMGEIQMLARSHAPEAIEALVAILKNKRSPAAAKVRAAEVLLDRGFGKPAQHLNVSRSPLDDLDAQSLAALAEALGLDLDGNEQQPLCLTEH